MSIPLDQKYHPSVLQQREKLATSGSFRERVQYDLIQRPNYAFGLLAAADMARFCGYTHITAIEFGVAEGQGLLNLCELAPHVTEETGVKIDIIGFDTGGGLPELVDYRDHPEIWSAGDFGGVDKAALESKLPSNARIIWGDIRETISSAIDTLSPNAPVGFVSLDVDLYSSTMAALKLFETDKDILLPVTLAYFDDTIGSPTRIGTLFRNRWCGQLSAIDDFNQSHTHRKIDQLYTLKARRPLDKEVWLDQMYTIHALDHRLRQVGADRPALKMDEHGTDDVMNWAL